MSLSLFALNFGLSILPSYERAKQGPIITQTGPTSFSIDLNQPDPWAVWLMEQGKIWALIALAVMGGLSLAPLAFAAKHFKRHRRHPITLTSGFGWLAVGSIYMTSVLVTANFYKPVFLSVSYVTLTLGLMFVVLGLIELFKPARTIANASLGDEPLAPRS